MLDRNKFLKSNEPGTGVYIDPGVYKLQIERVRVHEGHKGTSFIVDFTVLESERLGTYPEPTPTGTRAAYVVKLDDPNNMGLGAMKAFFRACEPSATDELLFDLCQAAIAADQPLKGATIRTVAQHKKTAKGNNFTTFSWKDYQDPSAAAKEAEVPF